MPAVSGQAQAAQQRTLHPWTQQPLLQYLQTTHTPDALFSYTNQRKLPIMPSVCSRGWNVVPWLLGRLAAKAFGLTVCRGGGLRAQGCAQQRQQQQLALAGAAQPQQSLQHLLHTQRGRRKEGVGVRGKWAGDWQKRGEREKGEGVAAMAQA